ncbi:DUF3817 domain-containing protein [Agromyces seonyuensis]|uniref:DUF3817 domain-containing protein n=1 Tax=Agromyces seonyuensis TaxID=2662446 RepID=A0A6I4NX05_9MICO|nr:DUF3817 domain-containing protein [Agromyces seonyuensis]MWB98916.1 DUF3817 domain-containing protein [Agromyces seonyuensis]
MPLEPKAADLSKIPGRVKFYQVASIITGTMLLLLVAEMVLKYGFHLELYGFSEQGFLYFAPTVETAAGWVSTGVGANLSTGILIAHGWFYVVYLFACFNLWSIMRWTFPRFLLLACGGIIPFLSFFLEARVARDVRAYVAGREARNSQNSEVTA